MLEDPLVNRLPFWALWLPLAGFIVLSLFGDWIRDQQNEARAKGDTSSLRANGMFWAMIMGCATVVGAFVFSAMSVVRLLGLLAGPEGLRFSQPYLGFEWIEVAGLRLPLSLLLDPLSSVMILTVTGVGGLIHIYSVGYMAHDEERVRYFSYLNLFTFFMLLLVLGGNLPLMFVGWEGVGLCSYLLIGFWYKKQSASDAGKKAFIVNRIGDAGFILGMILTFYTLGSLDLVEIAETLSSKPAEAMGEVGILTTIALLFFIGACGKSAQIPLHVWLPDAMEGPTPVSALIHAATMVTAGVYMVARLGPLYAHAPTAMAVVAVVGTATALMAGTVAVVQTDIKRVLAYSTVSQLGYMFLACGVGAFGVGIFHLFTHAFFKALLFLGSGSVIHALSGEQDMRRMGGLKDKIPYTFWTFAIGTLAIAGIYPLAGFFSKDEILASALAGGWPLLFGVGLFTALLTAFYMARLLFGTFFGAYRGPLEAHAGPDHGHGDDHGHGHAGIHESPWSMLGPLVALAAGSIVAGFIHVPAFVAPAVRVEAPEPHFAWLPWLASAAAILGIALGYYLYVMRPELPAKLSASFRPLQRVLEAKYYFDDVYNAFAARVVVGGSERALWKGVDTAVIDGAVNGAGKLVSAIALTTRYVQTGLVRGYALVMLGGAVAVLYYLLWLR